MNDDKPPLVLTIDDEKAVRDSIRLFLEDLDYMVADAENGQVGLDVYFQKNPDVVIVDLRMPGVDGLDVLAEVKETSPETPVIVASGTGIIADVVEALHLGASDYILKPIEDMSILDHSIRRAMERSRLIRERAAYQEHLEEQVAQRTEELQRINETLRDREENLAITLKSIGDAVIVTDADGMVTRMNRIAEQLTGWEEGHAQGRPLSDVLRVIDSESREPLPCSVEKVIRSGQSVDCPIHTIVIAKDGKERRIVDSASPIRNAQGQIVGVVLVFRDVTEEYCLQEQLRQSQKMEAIGQLAGGVAHDFNNVLTAILGNGQLLAMKFSEGTEESHLIREIIDASSRAAEMTRRLLTFSRKAELQMKSVDINTIVSEAVHMLTHSVDRRIGIVERIEASPGFVLGDQAQLHNAILNLGINARDAMPDGGEIVFTTRNVVLDQASCRMLAYEVKPGAFVQISVADTGDGMDGETQKRIFEPFFTTKEPGKGTGLGLATVYGCVRNHNGSIQVSSEVGRGTIFTILIPEAEHIVTRPVEAVKETLMRGKGHVLIVDDEEIVRNFACSAMEGLGYDVSACADGLEAVEFYRENHCDIDLVILDLIMPRLSGEETFLRMKEIDPDARVILVSGIVSDIIVKPLVQEGAVAVLGKPFRIEELSQAVACNIRRMTPR